MARRTKEDAEKTRELILEAALKVFSEKGYSKTTFVDIANEIDLSKGAVYWHFKTKADLLAAVILYGHEKQCDRMDKPEPETVAEMRANILGFATQVVRDDAAWKFEFFCNFQIEWSTELIEEVHEKMAELRTDPMKEFEEKLLNLQKKGALSTEVDANTLACCIGAAWHGSIQMAMHCQTSRERFAEILMTTFDLTIGKLALP